MNKICWKLVSILTVFGMIMTAFIGIWTTINMFEDTSVLGDKIIVDINGQGNYSTIQNAIDNANSGDIIQVWSGIYYENLKINKQITLIGNSSINTIVNGSGKDDVIFITANNVKITGFTITNSGNLSFPYDD